MKKILVILFLFFSASAQAEDFEPTYWSEGLHLFAGGGINSSVYNSNEDRDDGGLGLNLKTDLFYVLDPEWALEWSANVKFNRVRSYLLWDTLLTVGVRRQIPVSILNSAPYSRIFLGRAPTVLFLEGDTSIRSSEPGVSRIHFDGPVAGLGFGVLKKSPAGQVWFSEISVTVQKLEQSEDVRMDGEVPVVVSSNRLDNDATIYSVSWTVGVLAF